MAAVSSLIAGGTALAGTALAARSASQANRTMQEGTQAQLDLQREIYQDQRNLQQPFYETGVQANAAAAQMMGLNGGYQMPAYGQQNTYGGEAPFSSQMGLGAASGFGGGPVGRARGGQSSGFGGRQMTSNGQGGYMMGGMSQPSIGVGGGAGVSPPRPFSSQMGVSSNGSPVYQNQQLTNLQQSPGYQFRMQEGMNNLETGAAARGGLLSGQHLRAATRYGQDYASNEFNNRFNQMQALSGGGQAAGNATSNAAQNYGTNASNALGQSMNAQANLQQQRGSIYGQGLGTIGGIFAGGFGGNKSNNNMGY